MITLQHSMINQAVIYGIHTNDKILELRVSLRKYVQLTGTLIDLLKYPTKQRRLESKTQVSLRI